MFLGVGARKGLAVVGEGRGVLGQRAPVVSRVNGIKLLPPAGGAALCLSGLNKNSLIQIIAE